MHGLTAPGNPCVQFMLKNHCFAQQKDKEGRVQDVASATHYMMDGCFGGVVIVGWGDNAAMLEAYAKAKDLGMRIFMLERRTPVFRSLADIDFTALRALREDEEMLLFQHQQTVHKMFYPDWKSIEEHTDLFQVFVLATTCDLVAAKKPHLDPNSQQGMTPFGLSGPASADAAGAAGGAGNESSKPPTFKCGYHLIFVNLFLNDVMADRIHASCVAKAKQKWPDTQVFDMTEPLWEKIIDRSVIDANGLRMVGSHKPKKCPECNGSKSKVNECGHCDYTGRIDTKRPYELKYVLNSNGQRCPDDEAFYKANFAALVKRVSIRTNRTTPTAGFKPYAGAPTSAPHSLVMNADGKLVSVNNGFAEDNKAQSRMREKIRMPYNDPLIPAIRRVIRKFDNARKNVDIRAVYMTEKKDRYRVTLSGDGSQSCPNLINRDHNSNTEYIIIEKKDKGTFMWMKCHCQCPTTEGRVTWPKKGKVQCKNWISDMHKISDEESDAIMPTFMTKAADVMKKALRKSVYHFDPTPNGAYCTLRRIVQTCASKVMAHLAPESQQEVVSSSKKSGNKKRKRVEGTGTASTAGIAGMKKNDTNGKPKRAKVAVQRDDGSVMPQQHTFGQVGMSHGDEDEDHPHTVYRHDGGDYEGEEEPDHLFPSDPVRLPPKPAVKRKRPTPAKKTKPSKDQDEELNEVAPWVSLS
jgi:hypothetical protein